MRYDASWHPPWRHSEQAACVSSDCTLRGARLCVKATMVRSPAGLHCVQCAKRLGLGAANDERPTADEQLQLEDPET